MTIGTTIMGLLKGEDSDNAEVYLKTNLAAALDKIDAHDHTGGTKGAALGAFSNVPKAIGNVAGVTSSIPAGAALLLDDTGTALTSGGTLMLGAGGRNGAFGDVIAEIRASLQDNTANAAGGLVFLLRKLTGDTSVTELMHLFASGGLAIGTGQADPGANNLSVPGRITSPAVGASAKTLLNFVPLLPPPSTTLPTGNFTLAFTVNGLPSGAVAGMFQVTATSTNPGNGALVTAASGGTLLALCPRGVATSISGPVTPGATNQLAFGGADIGGGGTLLLLGYWEPA